MMRTELTNDQRLGVSFLCCSIILAFAAVIIGLFLALTSGPDSLISAYDAERVRLARELQGALSTYMFEQWEMALPIEEGVENATPVCKEGVSPTKDPDCISLDALISEYIGCLPQDHAETTGTRTGFTVYVENNLPRVSSPYMGEKKQVGSRCD